MYMYINETNFRRGTAQKRVRGKKAEREKGEEKM